MLLKKCRNKKTKEEEEELGLMQRMIAHLEVCCSLLSTLCSLLSALCSLLSALCSLISDL
jgi:hypothetical protein